VEASFSSTTDELGLRDRMCLVAGLSHDEFLTAMSRSLLYLRTPVTDGVCSSVLEALALGVPVVACDNGSRPRGVVTYPPEDPQALADAVRSVLRAPALARRGFGATTDVPDTVRDEVELLAAACQSGARGEAVTA
jgi:glycosyltransferase involved in cell wall biosynthesis